VNVKLAVGPVRKSTTHGLFFLMLLSFAASFLIARVFATLNPSIVVEAGGIHFHHFWYGLVLMVAAGALGILHSEPRWRRLYAVAFGFGGGIAGDEVGLLLTFGNYNSALTLDFFIIVVSFGVLGMLLSRFRKELEYDVIALRRGERLVNLGALVAGLSSLWFAAGSQLYGVLVLVVGVAMALVGFLWRND
jgi:hypothetical protein